MPSGILIAKQVSTLKVRYIMEPNLVLHVDGRMFRFYEDALPSSKANTTFGITHSQNNWNVFHSLGMAV